MNTTLKIILIFLVTIILALVLAPVGGALHNSFWEYRGGCGWWLPCDKGSQAEGFIYFYILLLSLSSFLFLNKKAAWFTFIIGSVIFWLLIINTIFYSLRFERAEWIGTLVIMVISFALGYGLAFGIKKFKKTKN